MLQISRMADYAVVLATHIANTPDHLHTAPDVAEATNLGEATVSKLLKLLAKKGILTSTRGARGGYSMAKSTAEISLADVVEAIDGPLALVWCTQKDKSRSKSCPVACACTAQNHWSRINSSIEAAMREVSIAELQNQKVPYTASLTANEFMATK